MDTADNCSLVVKSIQRDTNGDGYGNLCDSDTNNDDVVNYIDVAVWEPFFNITESGNADFKGDGLGNLIDYVLIPVFF